MRSIPAARTARGFSPQARTRKPPRRLVKDEMTAGRPRRGRLRLKRSRRRRLARAPRRRAGLPEHDDEPEAPAPSAKMFSPIPATIWSTAKRVAASAENRSDERSGCDAGRRAKERAPGRERDRDGGKRAGGRVIPSSAMLRMPARSQTTPASAAKISGVALTSVKVRAQRGDGEPLTSTPRPKRRAGKCHDRQALDDRYDVFRHVRDRLHRQSRRSARCQRRTRRRRCVADRGRRRGRRRSR